MLFRLPTGDLKPGDRLPTALAPLAQASGPATARAPGVYVHIPDGIIEFLVDTARGQQRFELWNAKELRAGGRD